MKAITLHRPWAQFVALGWKPIETRTHARFRSLVGERIAIHAGLKWDSNWTRLGVGYLMDDQLAQVQADSLFQISGAAIATCDVAAFQQVDGSHSQAALIDCQHTKRFGLFLENIKLIEPPIYCCGGQGIFNIKELD